MKVLGIVTARGGSKGIPRKNVRLLAGKPLLQYTAEAALGARSLERTLLTTDDAEIAALGEGLGLWVPFMRPAELARDDTPTVPVLLHVVEWLMQHDASYDAYCLLQPTAPLRASQHIDEAINLLSNSGADSVVSVVPVPSHYNPAWQMSIASNGTLALYNGEPLTRIVAQRQSLGETFIRNGAIYVMRHATLVEKKSLYGDKCLAFVMSPDNHVNIDTLDDWDKAERALTRRS